MSFNLVDYFKYTKSVIGFLCLLFLFSTLANSEEIIVGRVIGVADGDTISVLVADREKVKIRLANIDAPEKAQPFGNRAKQAMSDLAFGKSVECHVSGLDRYRRSIAVCTANGADINLELVRRGLAWVYPKYAKNVPAYYEAEDQARNNRMGLWGGQDPVPPWEWRQNN